MLARLQHFSADWGVRLQEYTDQRQTGSMESKETQTFWNELLACFGVDRKSNAHYERSARRASNSSERGRIDMFWPGTVLVEQKSPGKDLEAALAQGLEYLEDRDSIPEREQPRFVIACDFGRFILLDCQQQTRDEFALSDVPERLDSLLFLAGAQSTQHRIQRDLNAEASLIMARLYTAMAGNDADSDPEAAEPEEFDPSDAEARTDDISIFLTRLLFLLFGDDAGLWQRNLFERYVEQETSSDGIDLGPKIQALFEWLDKPLAARKRTPNVPEIFHLFPYVNGSLFAERRGMEFFNRQLRDELLKACRFDWSQISPAIFGSMFQLVKSKKARRENGEHYTSEENILKTLEPLFVDELRQRARALVDSSHAESTKRKNIIALLRELQGIHCMDPACGSGNFLLVAYAQVRAIETELLVELRRLDGSLGQMSLDATLETYVSVEQFHGIELGWWPARIAEVAMYLAEFQADRQLAAAIGQLPERLPLKSKAHIVHADALTSDWRAIVPADAQKVFIFGNPPFLGQAQMSKAQKESMKAVWGKDYDGYLDFVTGWFKKSMDFFVPAPGSAYEGQEVEGEFAFVSTNSITQGQPVPALFGPLFRAGWNIKFAYRTFPWSSQAPGQAAVHCVITGFARGLVKNPQLREYDWQTEQSVPVKVKAINAYLLDAPNVLVTKRMKPLAQQLPVVERGSQPTDGGNLIVEVEQYTEVMADPIAARYVRPFTGAKELVRGLDRWCLWLEDATPADRSKSPVLKERIAKVKAMRLASSKAATREKAEIAHLFDERRQPVQDYVCIPSVVSENRKFFTAAHFSEDVICSNLAFTAIDPDGFLFGVVSSSMFITWQKAVGGRLESRLRFANTLVWNNLPLPKVPQKLHDQICAAGQELQRVRESLAFKFGGRVSLADMYNPWAMDPELLKAHRALDRLVDKAFGASKTCADNTERLTILFKRYAELTEEERAASAHAKGTRTAKK
ncbi:MAG: GcrY protein [Rothia sp. (in: high G+C Gram-positive bacteria)]|uniref:DNA methyltransferase n=1 Tax=Rothia sp. (in: high G+C Gram-positive bacteria) TaxID=1885016 RepID=UPI0026E0E90D|nr:DNA methyltransferase [Rothia sp. (in: high G+C Gram-positive bacteria)]MDO5750906.1 GcrY protein [Rothia sp. (in: high G+C Gram-positive bacteria)]